MLMRRPHSLESLGIELNCDATQSTSERDAADGNGMTRAEMQAAHPTYVLPDAVDATGWYRGPGKESDDECRARAKRVLERVRATASGST